MCLIAISPKGTNKYSDFFINGIRESAYRNNDGFGFSFKKDNTKAVYIAKGYMDINKMIDEIRDHKLKDEDELIVHLRMRSAGSISPENTHPFELNIGSSAPVPYSYHGKTTLYPVMFHNGTFPDFVDTTKNQSDTYNFANKLMKSDKIWKFLVNDTEKFKLTFNNILKTNRLAFISKESEMILLGEWITDENYIFSNTSYKKYSQAYSNYLTKRETTIPDRTPNTGDPIPSLNTKIIKVNETNFKRFIVKSHCSNSVGSKIEKDEYFTINKYDSNNKTVLLEEKNHPGSYRFIDTDVLNAVFILIPKPEYSRQYVDYIKMVGTISATKSSVKKIYNKVISLTGRRASLPTEIEVKLHDKMYTYDYKAVLMFLNDYKHFIDAYKVKNLLELSEPIKNDVDLNSCTC